ncbi:Oidioi.mRNA.OKI2018_I69.chr2.g5213.t1.cds [Oikopleura dioica]|uniref:Oidioi.mRNA.OKI2018_I69.chr2.g5213.t1.cds n=1 Tax=Oikopleura dioica TaxID=34765 RepID=A0ABN7T8U8_OIKDI|nr:Oidioi.mRNA.OKI2018_I69.chr2.g5213.t1.cds [Oikopleura dioica]
MDNINSRNGSINQPANKKDQKKTTDDSFLKLLSIPAPPPNYRSTPDMNKESCSSASQKTPNTSQLEPSSASLIPQLWNPQYMVGFEQFQAHIDEPAEQPLNPNNMDNNELNQLLDEFEDVFAKTGEDERFNPHMQAEMPDGNKEEEQQAHQPQSVTSVPRQFSAEELAPQIMVRKAKKQFVPEHAKDSKYWTRRVKNNAAARRSREARHKKENQIRVRAAWLEKENIRLRVELLDARQQLQDLHKYRVRDNNQ